MTTVGPATKNSFVQWNTLSLDSAILSSYRPSVYNARDYARQTSPSSKAGATVKRLVDTSIATARADLVPTGLGFVFESGREGGYPIVPSGQAGFRRSARGSVAFNASGRFYSYRSKRIKGGGTGKKALKFTRGDGGFAAYAIGGSMKAEPYINPAGVFWVRVSFPQFAMRTLQARGFGVGNIR